MPISPPLISKHREDIDDAILALSNAIAAAQKAVMLFESSPHFENAQEILRDQIGIIRQVRLGLMEELSRNDDVDARSHSTVLFSVPEQQMPDERRNGEIVEALRTVNAHIQSTFYLLKEVLKDDDRFRTLCDVEFSMLRLLRPLSRLQS